MLQVREREIEGGRKRVMFLRVLACKQNMCYYHNGFRRQIRKTEREREKGVKEKQRMS